jgi:hypothetical protein
MRHPVVKGVLRYFGSFAQEGEAPVGAAQVRRDVTQSDKSVFNELERRQKGTSDIAVMTRPPPISPGRPTCENQRSAVLEGDA